MQPVCDTCEKRFDDMPYRVIVLKDKEGEPIVVYFHYFFPCWDVNLLSDKFPDCKIVDIGFNLDTKDIPKNANKLKNLKQNFDLWQSY